MFMLLDVFTPIVFTLNKGRTFLHQSSNLRSNDFFLNSKGGSQLYGTHEQGSVAFTGKPWTQVVAIVDAKFYCMLGIEPTMLRLGNYCADRILYTGMILHNLLNINIKY